MKGCQRPELEIRQVGEIQPNFFDLDCSRESSEGVASMVEWEHQRCREVVGGIGRRQGLLLGGDRAKEKTRKEIKGSRLARFQGPSPRFGGSRRDGLQWLGWYSAAREWQWRGFLRDRPKEKRGRDHTREGGRLLEWYSFVAWWLGFKPPAWRPSDLSSFSMFHKHVPHPVAKMHKSPRNSLSFSFNPPNCSWRVNFRMLLFRNEILISAKLGKAHLSVCRFHSP